MRGWPSTRAGWALTLLLTLAYVFSYVDRSILGLLIEPIKADIHLTDAEMGLLIGPAFALFYATIGLPMGWLADRRSRTRLVALGVMLWSLATAASGLARGFVQLMIARMSVGVGEAVLSPCALSMISDSFPPERRAKPVAVYNTSISIGGGLASLIGAGVLAWTKSAGNLHLPLLGEVRPWQSAFLAVGLPGLVLALPFLVMREPARMAPVASASSGGQRGYGAVLAHIGQRWPAFVGLVSLACVMTIVAYSHGFLASAFARHFHWQIRDFAVINGIVLLAVGPATVTATGALCDRWRAAGRADAPFLLMRAAYVVLVIAGSSALLLPSAPLAFVGLALTTICIGAVTVTGLVSLLDITPADIRGQVVALYYMCISVAGLGLGPTTVGLLSTRLYGEARLHLALATVPALFGLVPLLLLGQIGRHYRAERAAVAAKED